MEHRRPIDRSSFLDASEALLVLSSAEGGGVEGELFIAVDRQGAVTAFNGHVDLGTGIRTALAQIVAEELDVTFGASTWCSARPAVARPGRHDRQRNDPDDRRAAARGRRARRARFSWREAAEALGAAPDELSLAGDGMVRPEGSNRDALLRRRCAGRQRDAVARRGTPVKPVAELPRRRQPVRPGSTSRPRRPAA